MFLESHDKIINSKSIEKNQVFNKIDKSDEKMMHFNQILEGYNFLNYQKVLRIIKRSDEFDSYIYNIAQDLCDIDYIDPCIAKNNSKILIFLITKSYFESKLFEKHCFEASQSNKEVFLILQNDKDLNPNNFKFQDFKLVFQPTVSYTSLLNNYSYPKCLNELDKEFTDYILNLKNSFPVSI